MGDNIGKIIFAAVLGVLGVIAIPLLWETQDASEIMIVQALGTGDLTVYTDQGTHWQGGGKVTTYPRQKQYDFTKEGGHDTTARVQFNDGGFADLYGSVLWSMPTDEKSIIQIHKKFANTAGVENGAVIKSLASAIYMSGPLMSSTESAAERRGELVQVINDQAERGVYITRSEDKIVKDEDAPDGTKGAETRIKAVEILRDDKGMPKRQQGSILSEYNIKLQPIAITKLDYDDIVKGQIKDRQKSTTSVQLSQANAKRAIQDAITADAQGRANAAEAKWKQEVIKATVVTEAQQKLEVAQLAAKEADAFKTEQILRGQGEAERKRLVMAADGALDPKLKAYVEVNTIWADAFSKYGGAMVPSVVMGGSGGQSGNSANSAQTVMDLFAVKSAKDLSLDVGVRGNK